MRNLRMRIPWQNWKPRLLDSLAGYSRKLFLSDLIAGLTVGLVALPLGDEVAHDLEGAPI
jgi:MFS superfamily sulfate permease-like transporter